MLSWSAVDRSLVEKLTAKQHALFATWQLEVVESALRSAVKTKWLEPYRWRSVYGIAGAAPTLYRPLMGACLAAGPKSAASGLGAAWLYGAPDVAPAVEIVAFGHRARLPGVRCRESTFDATNLVTTRFGVPAVIPELCIIQVAGVYPTLAQLIANNFVARGLTGFKEIVDCLETLDPHGRGSRELRAFCLRELEIRGHDDSVAARALGRALVAAGLGPFDTQNKVEDEHGIMWIDFAFAPVKVGIEYMGWKDHGSTRNAMERDARRRARLSALGWVILDATGGMSHAEIIAWTAATIATRQKPAL